MDSERRRAQRRSAVRRPTNRVATDRYRDAIPVDTPGETRVAEGLGRVFEAVNSSLELKQVLYLLVDVVVEVTGAERALIFLLKDGCLVPTAVGSAKPNAERLHVFRRMEPIALEESLARRLVAAEPVTIADTSGTPLVPAAWVKAFGARAVTAVPVVTSDGPRAVLVLDNPVPHEYSTSEHALALTFAQAAASAIACAEQRDRLGRTAMLQRELATTLAKLATEDELGRVIQAIRSTVSSLFSGRACSISFGTWGDPHAAVQSAGGELDRTIVPVRAGGQLFGHLSLHGGPALSEEEIEVLEAFGAQAGIAIERERMVRELRRSHWQEQAALRLADVELQPGCLRVILGKLNRDVCHEAGFECVKASFRRRRIAELFGSSALAPPEIALASRLTVDRIKGQLVPRVDQISADGTCAVAIPVFGRVAGVLYARSLEKDETLIAPQKALLQALAARLGEVAQRARLQDALRDAEARLHVTRLRRHVAERFDATVGATLRTLWEELSSAVTRDEPDLEQLAEMRDLAARGLMEAHYAAEAIAVVGVRRGGLREALGKLLKSFESITGVSASLQTSGQPFSLALAAEEHFYAIAFDALWAVERAARASIVVVSLDYGGDGVTLGIRDDGTGLAQRGLDAGAAGLHFGIGAIRDRVVALGGGMRIEPREPRGARLVVHVPVERSRVTDSVPAARRPRGRRLARLTGPPETLEALGKRMRL